MTFMKYSITIVVVIFLFVEGCKPQDYTTQKLNECIQRELHKRRSTIGYNESQNVSNTFEAFEKFLLKREFLKEINKYSYEELIQKVIENPNGYKEIYNHVHDEKIYYDDYIIMNPALILSQCRDFVLVTEKNDYTSTLNVQYKIMQGVIKSNYGNMGVIKELFYNTPDKDFAKITYRVPFIYIITMNLEISAEPRNN